jgi:hypothetical protein
MSHLYCNEQQPSVTASHLTVTANLITSNEGFEGWQTSQIFVWTACCVGQYNADKLLHDNNNKYWEESTKLQWEQTAAEWLQIQDPVLSTSIPYDQTTLFKSDSANMMLVEDLRFAQQWCLDFKFWMYILPSSIRPYGSGSQSNIKHPLNLVR